jgi:hypothetical protein
MALVMAAGCSSSAKGTAGESTTAASASTTTAPSAARSAPAIDMATATSSGCRPATGPGAGHPDPLVARVFNVTDAAATAYLVGWQIVPYRGPKRSYTFGTGGNVIALQPATGGKPLGYGTGTVTFAANADAGTLDVAIKLKDRQTVKISGAWHCSAPSAPVVTTPTAPSGAGQHSS